MKKANRIISMLLCLVLVFAAVQASALKPKAESLSQIQERIDRLKKEKASNEAVLAAIREKMNVIAAQIAEYNAKIEGINSTIAANKEEIKKTEAQIEQDKLTFKKRIRSIYMSNSDSSVRILMGAENFSQFLQLSQLTASVSAHDKKMIENLAAEIKTLNEKNAENEKLLEEQVSLKSKVDAQYAELSAQEGEAKKLYDKSSADLSQAERDKEAEQKRMEENASGGSGSGGNFINPNSSFMWPCQNYYYISAGYNSNDYVHNGTHYGIDIAGGGIMGKPIRAMADGYVTYAYGGCGHNYGKNWSCGCGGGYGNWAQINHGTINGNRYSAVYAHATSIIVSTGQYVKQGQVIGYVGTTGWSTGAHLHFGLLENGGWVNPSDYSYRG